MSDNSNPGPNFPNVGGDFGGGLPPLMPPMPVLNELQEAAKAEVLLQSSPVTRELYAYYTVLSRMVDTLHRYDVFTDEERECVKEVGKKIVDLLLEKAKEIGVDEGAIKSIVSKSVFE